MTPLLFKNARIFDGTDAECAEGMYLRISDGLIQEISPKPVTDKDARVIIISAMGQESLVMEAINVGAKDYVLKPFSSMDVLKTLERALLDESQLMNRKAFSEKIG